RFSPSKGVTGDERFVWEGLDATQEMMLIGKALKGFGGDPQLFHLQYVKRVRFAPQSFDTLPSCSPSSPPSAPPAELGVPQITKRTKIADYGSVTTEHGTFGYIRLRSFDTVRLDNDPTRADEIVDAFIPRLARLPRNGLIIDMRGNTGGYITAAERVLQ